jgi:hypothetical protein
MTAIILVLILAAVFAGVLAAAGGGLFSLIVIGLGIAIAVWLGLAGGSKTDTRDVARRGSERGELLGPGGPDDPTS